MNATPQNNPSANPQPKWRRLRRRLVLFSFSLLVFLAALKLADVVIGRAWRTQERHWLRLVPNAHVTHKSNEFEYVYRTFRTSL